MTTQTFANDTIVKMMKLAIEKCSIEMLDTLIAKKLITLEEAIKEATSASKTDLITYLLNKNVDQTTVPAVAVTPPPVTITKRPVAIRTMCLDNSFTKLTVTQLIDDAFNNPLKALEDLQSGIVSKKELDYVDQSGWNILHFICYYQKRIAHGSLLVEELLKHDVNFNLKSSGGGATPLWFAVVLDGHSSSEKETIVEALMSMPNINTQIGSDGYTVFTQALRDYGDTSSAEFISALLMKYEKNFDINEFLTKISDPTKKKRILYAYFKYISPNMGIYIKKCGTMAPENLKKLIDVIETRFDGTYVFQKESS